jgi:hypothetical protein
MDRAIAERAAVADARTFPRCRQRLRLDAVGRIDDTKSGGRRAERSRREPTAFSPVVMPAESVSPRRPLFVIEAQTRRRRGTAAPPPRDTPNVASSLLHTP